MRKTKIIICISILLVISVGINLSYMIDYHPALKEVETLTWNPNYTYTLANPDEQAGTLIIGFDENYNPKQFIKLEDTYNFIFMVEDGLIISNDNNSIKFENVDGKLVENPSSQYYNLGEFITSSLVMGVDGTLQLQKTVNGSNIKYDELKKEQRTEVSIYQIYSIRYDNAFVVDGINYIPRDFDGRELRN